LQHRPLRSLLPLLLQLLISSTAQAAVFHRLADPPATVDGLPVPALAAARVLPAATLLEVDRDGLAAFRAAGGGTLSLPTADGGTLELELAPYQLLAGAAPITATDASGRHAFSPDVSLYRGHVVGESSSWAVIAMGPAGVFGSLEHAGRRWNLGPAARTPAVGAAFATHALTPEQSRPADEAAFQCGIDEATEAQLTTPLPPELGHAPKPGAAPAAAAVNHTAWAIAVDCDYEVYHLKFGDDLNAATSYVLTVLGIVNSIYERDLSATLVVPYLNFWTTAADPYTASTTATQLTQLAGYWNANQGAITRSAAFLMSGRPLGGGNSFIGGLCSSTNGYALAAMDFIYTYPTATTTWDVAVVAHELGHVFGSWHTHSCNWAQQGFVPPNTTLDSCFTAEGGCATYSDRLPPNKGTIMSYCYVGFGVAEGLRLDFHPVCIQRIQQVIAASACTTQVAAEPPANPAAGPFANGVRVTWSASASPGVIGYTVYRSTSPGDATPERAGFTPSLQFDDASLGLHYYRVRATRATDSSAFSPEVAAAPVCGSSAGAAIAAGSQPLAGASADLNGDGREDVVWLRRGDHTAGVFFGQGTGSVGNGTFSAPTPLLTLSGADCVAIGDVNGDGLPDILYGASYFGAYGLRVFRGQGVNGVPDGTFMGETGIANLPWDPTAIITADVDEDGLDDILVADGNTVLRLIGHGTNGVADGTFGLPQTTPTGPGTQDLIAHDFNADGVLDLAVSGAAGLEVLPGSGLNGRGDGTFNRASATMPAGLSPGKLAVTDLNQDGADDLVVADRADTVVRVFLGHLAAGVPDGTFAPGVKYGAGPHPGAIRVVDWDRNGKPDLLVTNDTSPGTVSVLLGRGDGTLANRVAIASGGDSTSDVVVADFDDNGSLEALVANRAAGTYERIAGSCSGPLSNAVTLTAPNGGESWLGLQERTVSWTKGPGVLSVDLQLSLNAGATWRTIAHELTGTSWKWTVPNLVTSQARVRVVVHGMPQSNDASNANFSIGLGGVLGVDAGPGCSGCAGGVALLGAWPNPTPRELVVGYTLPQGARGTLELVDALGRRYAARELAGTGPAEQRVTLADREAVPPGVYLVRLKSAATLRFAKVTVVR